MVRKTSVLLISFVMAMSVNSAYSVSASKSYVDRQDNSLYNNQLLLRDMLNGKDADGNWLQLDTEAKLAIPAINELHSEMAGKQDVITVENPLAAEYISGLAEVATTGSYNSLSDRPEIPSLDGLVTSEQLQALQKTLEDAIAEKQEKGEYLEADDLTAINTAISNLESGKADVADVTALQTAINNLGNTYATKTDLTDAETRLQNAINAIEIPNLSEYAKSADVALTYATKSEIPSIEGLAEKSYVDEELAKKASAETVQNISNNYLSKTDAQNTYVTQKTASETYVTEQQVTQQITNVVGDDTTGLRKQVADNVAAIAENKAAIAGKADKSALETAVNDLNTKIDQAVIDSSNIDLSSYAKTEDVAKTYATIETVDAELDKKANVADLKALAYKDMVATADIEPKAVTMDKIAGRTPVAGETLLMSVDADGNVTWMSVEILR